MVNVGSQKGKSCLYKDILCQEGYCSECMIYLESTFIIPPLFMESEGQLEAKQRGSLETPDPIYSV